MLKFISANRIIGMFFKLLIVILFAWLSEKVFADKTNKTRDLQINSLKIDSPSDLDFEILEQRKEDSMKCYLEKRELDIKKVKSMNSQRIKNEIVLSGTQLTTKLETNEEQIEYLSADLSPIIMNDKQIDKLGFEFWDFLKVKSIKTVKEIDNYNLFNEYKDYLEFKILYERMKTNLSVREINDLNVLPSNYSNSTDEISKILKQISDLNIYTITDKNDYDKFMSDFKQFQIFRKYKEYKKYREYLEFTEYKNQLNSTITFNNSLAIIDKNLENNINKTNKNDNNNNEEVIDNVKNTTNTLSNPIIESGIFEYNLPKILINIFINFILSNLIDFLENLKENDDKSQFFLILVLVIVIIIYLFKRIYQLFLKVVINVVYFIRTCSENNDKTEKSNSLCIDFKRKFIPEIKIKPQENILLDVYDSQSINTNTSLVPLNKNSKKSNALKALNLHKEEKLLFIYNQSEAVYRLNRLINSSKQIKKLIGCPTSLEDFIYSIIKNFNLLPEKIKEEIMKIWDDLNTIDIKHKCEKASERNEIKCIASSDDEKEICNNKILIQDSNEFQKLEVNNYLSIENSGDGKSKINNEQQKILKIPTISDATTNSNTNPNNDVTNFTKSNEISAKIQISSFIENKKCDKKESKSVKSKNENDKLKEDIKEFMEEEKILKFDDLEVIGKGGFGVVIKGKHKIDQTYYAIKIVKLNFSQDKKLTDLSVVKEVNMVKRLLNKNVVRYVTCWFQSNINGLKEKVNKKSLRENDYFTLVKTNTEGGSNLCSQLELLSKDVEYKNSNLKSKKLKRNINSKKISPFDPNIDNPYKDIARIIEERQKQDSESSFDGIFEKQENNDDLNYKQMRNVIIEEKENSKYSESDKYDDLDDCFDNHINNKFAGIENSKEEVSRKKSAVLNDFSKKYVNFWDDEDSQMIDKSYKHSNNNYTNEEDKNDNLAFNFKYSTNKRRSTFDSNNKTYSEDKNEEKIEKRNLNSIDSVYSKRSKVNSNNENNNNKSSITPSNSRKINKHSSNSNVKKINKLGEVKQSRKFTMDLETKVIRQEEKINLYFFIQMELCEGLSLDKYLKNIVDTGSGISRKTIFSFLTQLLDGLKIVHSLNIIHRDIK